MGRLDVAAANDEPAPCPRVTGTGTNAARVSLRASPSKERPFESPMTKILQTPPERFATLPGFPYHAHSRTDLPGYAGLAMAYVDEGPRTHRCFSVCTASRPGATSTGG